MKKTLLIVAAVSMMFAACTKEEVKTSIKGMTMTADVTETKATIDKNGETGKWDFSWETNDMVSVTSPSSDTYEFIKDGGHFVCETATPVEGAGWTAVYPADFKTNGINLRDQDGTIESAMDHYYMTGTGSCAGAKLTMTMTPQLAVLALTNGPSSTANAKYAIRLGTSESYYTKLKGDGTWEMNGVKSNSFLHEFSEIGQTQYFVVPAGVEIEVRGLSFRSNAKTLTAGKVYNLTTLAR